MIESVVLGESISTVEKVASFEANIQDLTNKESLDTVFNELDINPQEVANEIRQILEAESVPLRDSGGEVRHILPLKEAAHYKEAQLTPANVAGRECLINPSIDWGAQDAYERTNLQRAERGLAPQDSTGKEYELHHVQQRHDGILAELTRDEHRGKGIDSLLHGYKDVSEIDRSEFNKIRAAHWRARAAGVKVHV